MRRPSCSAPGWQASRNAAAACASPVGLCPRSRAHTRLCNCGRHKYTAAQTNTGKGSPRMGRSWASSFSSMRFAYCCSCCRLAGPPAPAPAGGTRGVRRAPVRHWPPAASWAALQTPAMPWHPLPPPATRLTSPAASTLAGLQTTAIPPSLQPPHGSPAHPAPPRPRWPPARCGSPRTGTRCWLGPAAGWRPARCRWRRTAGTGTPARR